LPQLVKGYTRLLPLSAKRSSCVPEADAKLSTMLGVDGRACNDVFKENFDPSTESIHLSKGYRVGRLQAHHAMTQGPSIPALPVASLSYSPPVNHRVCNSKIIQHLFPSLWVYRLHIQATI